MPDDYLVGRILSHTWSMASTGELLANANDEINEDHWLPSARPGVDAVGTLWVNDLDRGPYLSNILAHRPDQDDAAGSAGRNLPHDASGRAADQGSAQNLFHNLFFTFERYDLSTVGRMKFNRRVGRKDVLGESVLYDKKYLPSVTTKNPSAWSPSTPTPPTSWK
uniref:hypothetical protein n=1 Tax=Massilia oculi TaxID=945844 RepID=UPI0036D343C6